MLPQADLGRKWQGGHGLRLSQNLRSMAHLRHSTTPPPFSCVFHSSNLWLMRTERTVCLSTLLVFFQPEDLRKELRMLDQLFLAAEALEPPASIQVRSNCGTQIGPLDMTGMSCRQVVAHRPSLAPQTMETSMLIAA